MRKSFGFLLLFVLLLQHCAFASGTHTLRMTWSDAAQAVQGRKVTIFTTSGASRKGRVAAVDADAVTFQGRKPLSVRRTDVAEIRFVEYVGDGRRIGRKIGLLVGFLGGIIGAVAIGMNENTSHPGRDKALATVCAVGGIPGGLAAGHYLGRLADRDVTIIRIIP